MLLIFFEFFVIIISSFPLSFNIMNIFKESLFSSSSSSSKSNTKRKSRQNQLKNYKLRQGNNSLSEPLLTLSDNDNNNIELGTIDSDNEDEIELNSLHIRSRTIKQHATPAAHGGGSIVIIEKPVRPQETIQAFAIRYRVPVSQLKRLNNLQNDQDFYALTYCRVPVRRFGLLHESSSSTILNLNEQTTNPSLPVTHLSQQNHHAFLNAMDQDLASMRAKVEQLIETPQTTAILTSNPSTTRMILRSTTKPVSDLNCDGADCGCKFWHIIIAIVLIALLVPLIYIYIYIKTPSTMTDHVPK